MRFEWDPDKAAQNEKKHGHVVKENSMNKNESEMEDELRPEYFITDMKGLVRGKHAEEYSRGTNLILLAPDVADAFPTEESVNEALRLLIRVAKSADKRAG